MRNWAKWTGVAALALLAGSAVAADHGDGPAAGASPEGDINDLYAWIGQDDNLKLIMTIGGLSGPTEASKDVLYVFNVNRHDDALQAATDATTGTTTKVICQLDSATAGRCWVGGADYVSGDVSAAAGVTSDSGKVTVHAGPHKDPFFFYLSGFVAARDAVLKAAPSLQFYESGCPKLDAGTVTALQTALTDKAEDNLANVDSYAIVMSVDPGLFAGSGDIYSVWASTHAKK